MKSHEFIMLLGGSKLVVFFRPRVSRAMKCSKRSFAVVSLLFAVLLSYWNTQCARR